METGNDRYLTCSVHRGDDGVLVVRLDGELDLDTVDEARRVLIEAEQAADDADVVVDVSALDFIGATGLGMLSAAGAEHRSRRGRPLRIVGAGPLLRRLVQLDHVAEGLELEPPR